MPKEIKPNKLNTSQKRSAAKRKDQLKEQNIPQDHAEKLAVEEALQNRKSGQGGGSSAGGEAKHQHENRGAGGRQRTGSDSNASK